MSNKHLILRSEGEHFSYLVVVEVTPALVESVKSRIALAKGLKDQDSELSNLSFFFYGFDVYESDDCEAASYEDDSMELVDGLPENLGERMRRDFGNFCVGSDGYLHLQYGIKHVHETHETPFFQLKDLLGDDEASSPKS